MSAATHNETRLGHEKKPAAKNEDGYIYRRGVCCDGAFQIYRFRLTPEGYVDKRYVSVVSLRERTIEGFAALQEIVKEAFAHPALPARAFEMLSTQELGGCVTPPREPRTPDGRYRLSDIEAYKAAGLAAA